MSPEKLSVYVLHLSSQSSGHNLWTGSCGDTSADTSACFEQAKNTYSDFFFLVMITSVDFECIIPLRCVIMLHRSDIKLPFDKCSDLYSLVFFTLCRQTLNSIFCLC